MAYRPMSLCSMLAATAFSSAAFAGGACETATNDCATQSGLPGCCNSDCCTEVCGLDAFCCNTAWDSLCVNSAVTNCESTACDAGCPGLCVGDLAEPFGVVDGADIASLLGAWGTADECANFDGAGVVDGGDLATLLGAWGECPPPPSPCESADHDCCTSGTVGCTDTACCEIVCGADAFCCSTSWDSLCVSEAESLCGLDCGGGGACPPSDHDCFTTGGPGCTDTDCCSTVCAVDSFCCSTAWDGLCVGEAFSLCGSPECPFECSGTDEGEPCGDDVNGGCNSPQGQSNCCFANGGVGCDDAECQAIVCGLDSFCCSTAWDSICAASAATNCGDLCSGEPTFPFGSVSCGETICGTAWADGSFRDTDWYIINVPTATSVTMTVSSQLPMVFGLINSTDCATATAINPFGTTAFCGTTSIELCLPAGESWLFAAPNAFSGFPCGANNSYSMSIECGGECVPPACGEGADHDCFTSGTPFCTDEACCETVCAVDPFCCSTAWDGVCVGEANSFCVSCDLVCTGTAEGEPCGSDTNGGCNSVPPVFGAISCGETICGDFWADGSFRDTDWFQFELATATEISLTGEAEFGFVIGIVATGGIPDCALAAALNPFAVGTSCSSASASGCLNAGTWWAFIAPNAFAGLPCDSGKNDYSLTLNCVGECVPAACGETADHDCFTTGTPFCTDEACCQAVCAADPFCCTNSWDGLCVGEAGSICGGVSNCCFANGGLGCDDPTCQDAVCSADAFCCSTAWDTICAGSAASLCPELCGG